MTGEFLSVIFLGNMVYLLIDNENLIFQFMFFISNDI
jgi:hypothetical protein